MFAPPQSGRGKLLAPMGEAPKGQANTGVLYHILNFFQADLKKMSETRHLMPARIAYRVLRIAYCVLRIAYPDKRHRDRCRIA